MMQLRKDRKAIEMGFNWLFAILAGGFILFLAIYATSKLMSSSNIATHTETAAKIISLFDPLETGLAAGKSSEINFKKDTRIYFECDYESNIPFGEETIGYTEKVIGDKYGEAGYNVSIKDKYVFSEKVLEGKKLIVFSVPFFMPFKVSDLVIISSYEYCFFNTPDEIVEEVKGLNLKNIHLVNLSDKCEGIKVCFDDGNNCNIRVSMKDKYVLKDNKRLYFKDELVYGAIFASPDIYECNVKRLMSKFFELGSVYIDKIDVIKRKQCDPKIGAKLGIIIWQAKNITSSRDLIRLTDLSEEIDSINRVAKPGCELY